MYFKNGWHSRIYVVLDRPIYNFEVILCYFESRERDSIYRGAAFLFVYNT